MNKSLRILTSTLILAAMACPLQAQEEEAPTIIFISENTPAKTAMEMIILEEYNAAQIENLRTTDLAAYLAELAKPGAERFADIKKNSFREVPRAVANARYTELQTLLGLADTDPADKGFTDLLEGAGYTVYRSETIVTEDPITGAVTREHEFHGDIGIPFSPDGDYRLSEEQIAFLNTADLIIMSRDNTMNRYSSGGREAGQASTILIEQWNGLEVPIICMHNELMGTMEFGTWGWGWSYGFSGAWNAISPYDRREFPGQERFVFPDLRPAVRNNDPVFLAGVSIEDDNRLSVYMDTDLVPMLPQVQQKFSNNENYNYPASANVVLELLMPSFYVAEVGEIPVRTPVMMEFPPNIPAFNPTNGVPAIERVGIPADYRLYFATGMRTTGLYNLSEVGETVFLNAVARYTGGGIEPPPNVWYGYTYDDLGWTDTGVNGVGGWFNGWINVSADPWINVLSLGKYIYVPDASGWVYIPQ